MTNVHPDRDQDAPAPVRVRRAVRQIKSYAGNDVTQDRVRRILPEWHAFAELEPHEMTAVLAAFPPAPDGSVERDMVGVEDLGKSAATPPNCSEEKALRALRQPKAEA